MGVDVGCLFDGRGEGNVVRDWTDMVVNSGLWLGEGRDVPLLVKAPLNHSSRRRRVHVDTGRSNVGLGSNIYLMSSGEFLGHAKWIGSLIIFSLSLKYLSCQYRA